MAATMDTVTSEDNVSILDKLTSMFECLVCYDIVKPPIHACDVGHLVCSSCFSRVGNRCPTCRGNISGQRSVILERLTELILYPCRYTCNGCTTRMNLPILYGHEFTCEYKPCKCPMVDIKCMWKGAKEQLLSHLLENHPDIFMFKRRKLHLIAVHTDLAAPKTWLIILKAFKFYFIISLHKQTKNRETYLTIAAQLIGSEEQAKKFWFSTIISIPEMGKYIYVEIPVRGIQTNIQIIRESGDGVIIGEHTLRQISECGNSALIIAVKRSKTQGW